MSLVECLESRTFLAGDIPTASRIKTIVQEPDGSTASLVLKVNFFSYTGLDYDSIKDNPNRTIHVKGPGQIWKRFAKLYWHEGNIGGKSMATKYKLAAPGGSWTNDDIGTYEVYVREDKVKNSDGTAMPLTWIGRFKVGKPATIPNVQGKYEGKWDAISSGDEVTYEPFKIDVTAQSSGQVSGTLSRLGGVPKPFTGTVDSQGNIKLKYFEFHPSGIGPLITVEGRIANGIVSGVVKSGLTHDNGLTFSDTINQGPLVNVVRV